MAFAKKNWLDRQCETPGGRVLYPMDGGAPRTVRIERDEGLVYEEGDAFDAATMNDLEARIAEATGDAGEVIAAHVKDETNPHRVTKAQVGLALADNTPDEAKQVAAARYAASLGSESVPKDSLGVKTATGSPAGPMFLQNVNNEYLLTGVNNAAKPVYNALRLNGNDAGYFASQSALQSTTVTANNAYNAAAGALQRSGGTLTGDLRLQNRWMYFDSITDNCSLQMASRDSYNNAYFIFNSSGTGYMLLDKNNNLLPAYSSNLPPPSSARYKEELAPMSLADAERLLGLTVRRFAYRGGSGFDDGKRHAGLLAEDVAKLDATWVYHRGKEVEGVKYASLVPALLRIVQGQRDRLETLEKRLEKLEKEAERDGL